MKCLRLDLTDLVSHFCTSQSSTGIQRCQLLIAFHIVKHGTGTAFCVLGGLYKSLDDVILRSDANPDKFAILIRENFKFRLFVENVIKYVPNNLGLAIRAVRRCITEFVVYKNRHKYINPGDVVLVTGGFWSVPYLIGLYIYFKSNGATIVCFVHDLIPLSNPEFSGGRQGKALIRLLRLRPEIIANSHYTKSEIEIVLQKLNIKNLPAPVRTVLLAHEFAGHPRSSHISYGIPATSEREYVLCVGTICARKNQLGLAAIWKELSYKSTKALPLLVFAGKWGEGFDVTHKSAFDHPDVRWWESPTDQDLAYLYKNCLFTTFPSFSEGWGLPVGESLWFGKACAASAVQSIPEVGGNLCVYFDPTNSTSLILALSRLLERNCRVEFEYKIGAATLRTWDDVAAEVSFILRQIVQR